MLARAVSHPGTRLGAGGRNPIAGRSGLALAHADTHIAIATAMLSSPMRWFRPILRLLRTRASPLSAGGGEDARHGAHLAACATASAATALSTRLRGPGGRVGERRRQQIRQPQPPAKPGRRTQAATAS